MTLTNFIAKNVLLGDSNFLDLATEKLFLQGEGSIICEGLSFDICSQLVGLSGDIRFFGLLQKKLVLLGDLIKLAKIGVKYSADCADEMTSHMVAILGLNEAARVLVNARGVRMLIFGFLPILWPKT